MTFYEYAFIIWTVVSSFIIGYFVGKVSAYTDALKYIEKTFPLIRK